MQRQLLEAPVPEGDHAAPFDRRHALAGGADLARDLDRRVERLADVDIDEGLEKDVVAPVLVHQRRAGFPRLQHVVDGRQLVEIERDDCAMSSASARVAATHMATSSPT